MKKMVVKCVLADSHIIQHSYSGGSMNVGG